MKFLKWTGIIFLLLFVIYLIANVLSPNTMTVRKEIKINAPASQVFNQVVDLKTWNQWAKWHQLDPNMKTEITGEEGKVGLKSQWWSEHQEVGNGSQEIIELIPNEFMKSEMRFEGWELPSYGTFSFKEDNGVTTVEWGFDGAETPFLLNVTNALFAPMIEESFVIGLNNLKELVESTPVSIPNPMNVEVTTLESMNIVSIKDSTTKDGISAKLGEIYGELAIYLASDEKLEMKGMPMAMYYSVTPEKVVLEAAMQYTGEAVANGRIIVKQIAEGKALKGIHYGDYNASGKMHEAITAYGAASQLNVDKTWMEIYVNDPTTVDSAAVETHIYYNIQ